MDKLNIGVRIDFVYTQTMNKKVFIGIFIFLLILAVIIFGFKSCDARKKIITSESEEYSAFINANIEFTCELIKNPALADNNNDSQKRLNEIYEKYKLPVSDNEIMLGILKKYENNEEIAVIIQTNTQSCKQGGSPIFYKPVE